MEVRQKVYMRDSSGRYIPGEVVKITPSGMIDVKWGSEGTTSRFRKDGRRQGDDYYRSWNLDTQMPFEDRAEYVRNNNALGAAAHAINTIEMKRIGFWHGRNADKSDLVAELDRLQGLINDVRKLLETCK